MLRLKRFGLLRVHCTMEKNLSEEGAMYIIQIVPLLLQNIIMKYYLVKLLLMCCSKKYLQLN